MPQFVKRTPNPNAFANVALLQRVHYRAGLELCLWLCRSPLSAFVLAAAAHCSFPVHFVNASLSLSNSF